MQFFLYSFFKLSYKVQISIAMQSEVVAVFFFFFLRKEKKMVRNLRNVHDYG